jgi:hypothetical protein
VRPNLSVSKIVCDMNMVSFAYLLLHTFTAYLHVFLLHTDISTCIYLSRCKYNLHTVPPVD